MSPFRKWYERQAKSPKQENKMPEGRSKKKKLFFSQNQAGVISKAQLTQYFTE